MKKQRVRPLWVTVVAALGGLVFGYDSGAMSGALLFLKSAFHLTVFEREAMVSIVIVGAMSGSVIAGWLADRWGRRRALRWASAGAAIFAVGTGLAPTYASFLVARFFVGVMVGMIVVAAPMYISEFSKTQSRGAASATFQLAVAVGLTSSYWGDYFFAHSGNWHMMFAVAVIPALILWALLWSLPDTPRWYFLQQRNVEGTKALRLLWEEDNQQISVETTQITQELEATKSLGTGSYRDLVRPGVRPALLFGIGFSIFQQFSGINTVTYYSPTVFTLAGFVKKDAIFITAIIGLITIAATVLGISLIDRWGRRKLMFFSLSGMGLAMCGLGLAFRLGPRLPGMDIVTVGSVVLYHIAFSFGMGLMGWVLLPEVFPNRVRARAQSVGRLANWVANFIVTISFLSIVKAIGPANTFWTFTAIIVLAAIFIARLAPETRNRPLESIEQYWLNGMRWGTQEHDVLTPPSNL